jgi:hypothetical protein
MEMLTKDCRPGWQNCQNAINYNWARCPFHGDGLTPAQRIESDHAYAAQVEANRAEGR